MCAMFGATEARIVSSPYWLWAIGDGCGIRRMLSESHQLELASQKLGASESGKALW